MKRMLCILILALLLTQSFAMALTGSDFPAYDGTAPVQNAIAGSIAGSSLILEFDPSEEFSNINSGYIQACFFAYDSAEKNYIEIYLFLPGTIAAGDVINAQTAIENGVDLTCVGLYEVFENGDEAEYLAGQIESGIYPVNSSYTVIIDSAEMSGAEIIVSGSLDAVLVDTADFGQSVTVSGARFHFAMPVGNAPAITPQPGAPAPAASAPVDSIKV